MPCRWSIDHRPVSAVLQSNTVSSVVPGTCRFFLHNSLLTILFVFSLRLIIYLKFIIHIMVELMQDNLKVNTSILIGRLIIDEKSESNWCTRITESEEYCKRAAEMELVMRRWADEEKMFKCPDLDMSVRGRCLSSLAGSRCCDVHGGQFRG